MEKFVGQQHYPIPYGANGQTGKIGREAMMPQDSSSSYMKLAIDHMPGALGVVDSHGRVLMTNQRFDEIVSTIRCGYPDVITFLDADPPQGTDLQGARMADETLRKLLDGAERLKLPSGEIVRSTRIPTRAGEYVITIDDITEQYLSEQRYLHLARHDALTGLPNRRRFIEILDSALDLASSSSCAPAIAVICIDLDRFKYINDSYGHAAGDAVLRTISQRLSSNLKEHETVARFGGDEFVAMKAYSDPEELAEFIDRIHRHITEPMSLSYGKVVTGASLGVALYPADANDRESLIKNADLAMYRAKSCFGQVACYYDAHLDEAERLRLNLAQDMWEGLARDEFFLNYQIQKVAETNRTTGYEVLVRWQHPTLGLISPDTFIEIAEECGAIIPLGDWVLNKACCEAARWSAPYRIAVNLSPLQLSNAQIVERIREILLASGLAPNRLELEVTETALISDRANALDILLQIKAMGVSIALDDFGTGYSSFETLRAFPFDRIKLDRSFVAGLETNRHAKVFIRAILALGKSLAVPVLAEGVETVGQRDFLVTEGLDEFQGFLFGHPTELRYLRFEEDQLGPDSDGASV